MAADEWLERVRNGRAGYRTLLEESGSIAIAAHRLARAKCQCWALPTDVPNAREVHAAAFEIAERLGMERDLPTSQRLARACLELGLPLL